MTVKEYAKLVKVATGFVGMYPLVLPLKLGNYYQVNKDHSMVRLGNIFDWPGTAEAVKTHCEDIDGSETYYAGCKRSQAAGASGGIDNPSGIGAEATLALDFSREAGFVLAYAAGKHCYVVDVPALQKYVKQLVLEDKWERNWILVTEVIETSSATLAVSTQAKSSVELRASATLPAALNEVGIADPTLGWTASTWDGSGYTSICSPATPLFHCLKARRTLFGAKSELLGSAGDDDDELFVTDDPFAEDEDEG